MHSKLVFDARIGYTGCFVRTEKSIGLKHRPGIIPGSIIWGESSLMLGHFDISLSHSIQTHYNLIQFIWLQFH
jgi:hypothetical protein